MRYPTPDENEEGVVFLKEREAGYRALARHFPNGAVVLFDRELRYRLVDGMGLAAAGLRREDLEGRQLREIFPPPVCDVLEPHYRRALAGEEALFEVPFRDDLYEVRVAPVRSDDGAVRYGLAMTQRITERRRTEEALRKSEERHRLLLEGITDGVFLLDRDWRFVLINDAALGFLRRPREEMEGRTLEECFPGLEDDPFRHAYVETMETGRPATAEGRFVHDDGRERWYEVRVYPAQEGVLCFATDVTDRHRLDEARRIREETLAQAVTERTRELAERERYFRTLHDASPVGIVVLAPDGEIRDANERFAAFLRLEGNDAVCGRTFLSVVFSDDRYEWERLRREALRDPDRAASRDLVFERADAALAWGRVTLKVIGEDGGEGGGAAPRLLGIVEDIDAHIHAQERVRLLQDELRQSQKFEAVGQLAAGVAHDFNNRLGVIFGNLYLLKRRHADDERTMQWLETILSASRQAADLTERLLDYSRKEESAAGPVDIADLVQNVTALLAHSLDKRIRIDASVEAEETVVTGDASQLQNLLFNLAVNAADAMPDGGDLALRVDPSACPKEVTPPGPDDSAAAPPCLCITVRDTGCGIAPEALPHIFEPFFTTKMAEKGTGLGLAAVRDAVEAHHGHIEVESAPGEGAAFRVYLPLAKDRQAPAASDDAEPVSGTGRILLVDDEEDILEVVEEAIDADGFTATSCACPHEALQRFREDPEAYDLVLLDMVLPEMNGMQVFRELKKIDPDVQVLVTSGYLASNTVEEVLAEGAVGFLKKPYDINALVRAIADALQP